MRIGLFSDTYYPRLNGVATSVYMLKEMLEAMGHQVYVFTTTDPGAPVFERNVYRIPSIPFMTQRLGTFIRPFFMQKIKRLSLDIIHTHTEYTLGSYGRIVARKLGIPFVHTMHTIYEYYTSYVIKSERVAPAARAFARKLTSSFCNAADAVIVPSSKIDALIRTYGVYKAISVIPSGIPLEKFDADQCSQEQIDETRLSLGFAKTDKVLLNIGRVAEEKNQAMLLVELKDYFQAHPEVKLLVVGDGPAREGLEELTAELGMQDQVVFAGAKPWKEINLYYRLGDAFVGASESETQGLTYIEALASGVPIVARDDRCLDDVLVEGVNGFSYKTEKELTGALDALLFGGETRERLAMNAAKSVEKYSANAYAANVEGLYAAVIAEQMEHDHRLAV